MFKNVAVLLALTSAVFAQQNVSHAMDMYLYPYTDRPLSTRSGHSAGVLAGVCISYS